MGREGKHVHLPIASTSRCVQMLDLIKRNLPEKNNLILRHFRILDAIYLSSKGFVPRNLDHGH